jgi:DNA-binding HxlR family transcriptional regulator
MAAYKSLSKSYNCSFEITIDIMGGKWKSLILWKLHQHKVLRNGELTRLIPNITQKMLTQQLREMEECGLVERKVYEQVPPKVEYSLTEHGRKLEPIMIMMKGWGEEYADSMGYAKKCDS